MPELPGDGMIIADLEKRVAALEAIISRRPPTTMMLNDFDDKVLNRLVADITERNSAMGQSESTQGRRRGLATRWLLNIRAAERSVLAEG